MLLCSGCTHEDARVMLVGECVYGRRSAGHVLVLMCCIRCASGAAMSMCACNMKAPSHTYGACDAAHALNALLPDVLQVHLAL